MTLMNLLPGQYQMGDLVFGRGTSVPVDTFDPKPYDINNQDYQMGRNDFINFGEDQIKPTTIEITFNVRYNWLLPQYANLIPNFWANMPRVEDFEREWKSEDIKGVQGKVKPFYICDRRGITKILFGRCGQFTRGENSRYTEAIQCIGEFRRMDAYAYSAIEKVAIINQAKPSFIINGTEGDAPSWIRLFVKGPCNHPLITITNTHLRGTIVIDLNYNVSENEIVEISSYPWQQRVVNNANPPLTLASKLIGNSPYLDRMRIAHNAQSQVSFTAGGLNGNSQIQIRYRDGYQVEK